MGMTARPATTTLANGAKLWEHRFETFKVKVYVPQGHTLADLINFGFQAPYLIVFEEKEQSLEEAAAFAEESGLAEVAGCYSTSVVFVSPVCENGWDAAPDTLFADLIAESRIHQYHQDGYVTSRDRFTGQWGDCFIRGAIFRTCLFGRGKAAGYIARHCMRTLEGLYLWGPGEITPLAVVLENLSVMPKPERCDIPVVSIGNSDEINAVLNDSCDHLLIQQKPDWKEAALYSRQWKRWCGVLQTEDDFEQLGMVEETSFAVVPTSPDNCGDDRETSQHRIGYIAFYNKGLLDNGPVPLVLAFHGGGDSAYHIAHVSGWYRVANRNNFLLVAIENHLNSTATEVIALIDELKKVYPIDEKRIYASGFSMGGCKSWDLYQEYPQVFAALAPMDATFEVGLNLYGNPAPVPINGDHPVPLFYAGGEITPLPELPFQAEKCWDRMRYVFQVNQVKTPYDVKYEDKESWSNPIWGISGDQVETHYDASRDSVLTIHTFESVDGVTRTAFASISGQGHECREHTCEYAWKFMSRFTR